jgi:hypothetical protein
MKGYIKGIIFKESTNHCLAMATNRIHNQILKALCAIDSTVHVLASNNKSSETKKDEYISERLGIQDNFKLACFVPEDTVPLQNQEASTSQKLQSGV